MKFKIHIEKFKNNIQICHSDHKMKEINKRGLGKDRDKSEGKERKCFSGNIVRSEQK